MNKPKAPRRCSRHLEDDLTTAVATYLRIQYPRALWFHVPNGGRRNAREGARMKAMGVRPGVCDMLIFESQARPQGELHYKGLALELKIKPNRIEPTQMEFITAITCRGWQGVVAWSFDEAKQYIDNHLKP